MKNKIFKIFDSATIYSLSSIILRFATGPVTILLVASSLSQEEQGFYFAFFNALALNQILEAGIGFVLIQAISHKMSGLAFNKTIEGSSYSVSVVFDRIAFLLSWFLILAVFTATGVFAFGLYLFGGYSGSIDWWTPWVLFSLVNAFSLFGLSFSHIVEGLQRPQIAFKIQFFSSITSSIVLWLSLSYGLGLFSIVASSGVRGVIQSSGSIFVLKSVLKEFFAYVSGTGLRLFYKLYLVFLDIWPFFSKLSVTWIGGFFYWNSLGIVAFKFAGPVVAGKVGLSIALCKAGLSVGEALVASQRSRIGYALGGGDIHTAEAIYKMRNVFAHLLLLCGYCLFLIAVQFLPNEIRSRFVEYDQLILFCIAYFLMLYPLNTALFLRCFNREPFFIFSLVQNLIFPVGVFLMITNYGISSVPKFYVVLNVLSAFWAWNIFKAIINGKPQSVGAEV